MRIRSVPTVEGNSSIRNGLQGERRRPEATGRYG